MKKTSMIFLAGLLTSTQVLAVPDAFQKQCTNPENKKFVVSLYQPDISLAINLTIGTINYDRGSGHLCYLRDFQYFGESCAQDYPALPSETPAWTMVDLNGDKYFDLILSYFSGGMWLGERSFVLLANCGDGTYIGVKLKYDERLDESFGFAYVLPSAVVDKKTGWKQLYATRQYIRKGLESFGSATDDFNIQELVLEFNPDTFQYQTVHEGQIRRMTEQDEVKEGIGIQKNLPFDFSHFAWGEFPASIPRKFAPSFDCAKASTKVEKIICANGDLSRLDVALTANYKQIVTTPQLAAEQRAWLKQRNTCDISYCLLDAYIKRIDELCTKYPLKTGSCISSEKVEIFR